MRCAECNESFLICYNEPYLVVPCGHSVCKSCLCKYQNAEIGSELSFVEPQICLACDTYFQRAYKNHCVDAYIQDQHNEVAISKIGLGDEFESELNFEKIGNKQKTCQEFFETTSYANNFKIHTFLKNYFELFLNNCQNFSLEKLERQRDWYQNNSKTLLLTRFANYLNFYPQCSPYALVELSFKDHTQFYPSLHTEGVCKVNFKKLRFILDSKLKSVSLPKFQCAFGVGTNKLAFKFVELDTFPETLCMLKNDKKFCYVNFECIEELKLDEIFKVDTHEFISNYEQDKFDVIYYINESLNKILCTFSPIFDIFYEEDMGNEIKLSKSITLVHQFENQSKALVKFLRPLLSTILDESP
jgi:hypothetical protein